MQSSRKASRAKHAHAILSGSLDLAAIGSQSREQDAALAEALGALATCRLPGAEAFEGALSACLAAVGDGGSRAGELLLACAGQARESWEEACVEPSDRSKRQLAFCTDSIADCEALDALRSALGGDAPDLGSFQSSGMAMLRAGRSLWADAEPSAGASGLASLALSCARCASDPEALLAAMLPFKDASMPVKGQDSHGLVAWSDDLNDDPIEMGWWALRWASEAAGSGRPNGFPWGLCLALAWPDKMASWGTALGVDWGQSHSMALSLSTLVDDGMWFDPARAVCALAASRIDRELERRAIEAAASAAAPAKRRGL